jgi:tRNA(fMet)-specific endonuclease VapC
MPGNRFLLDTNALIALLQGNRELVALTQAADWLGVSVINVLEFLGFDGLAEQDRLLLQQFLLRVTVVDIAHNNAALMAQIAVIRQRKTLKLPDAIVLASAVLYGATVITNDEQMLAAGANGSPFAASSFSAEQ